MKNKLIMILSYVLSLALALNLFPIITFAETDNISSWEDLKSALEEGQTDICLDSDAMLKATSDIAVEVGKDIDIRVYAVDETVVVDMDHTNYSIYVSGEGKITFENIGFANYSNSCITNENSAYLDLNLINCTFMNGDGSAIDGKCEKKSPRYAEEPGLSVGASYDLNQLSEIIGADRVIVGNLSDPDRMNSSIEMFLEQEMKVVDNQTIFFNSMNNASGNVSFGIYDPQAKETYYSSTLSLVDGQADITIMELPAGNYQVVSVYGGNDKFLPMAIINNLSITKFESITNVTANQNGNGQMEINVNVDGDQRMVNLNGAVDVEVYQLLDRHGETLTNLTQSSVKSALICNGTSELNEGVAEVDLDELEEGVYSVQAYLRDNPFFEDSCGEVRIKVLRSEEPTTEPPAEPPAEPTTEEPTTEEPTELLTEPPTEPPTEEPTTEEPTELLTEPPTEPPTEEPTTEEPTTEEPTTEEPTTEEPTTVEQTTEEITTAEPTTVELTRAEFTTVESVTTAPETTVRKMEEKEPKGSVYRVLQLKQDKVSKKSLKIKWRKVKGAKTYVIYGSKCGLTRKCKKIAKTKKLAYTIKKLKKGTYYKFTVKALDEHNKVISVSKLAHIATDGGKKGNDKVVKVNAKQVSLNVGKTFKIKAKAIPKSKDQKVNRHRAIKYESDNQGIATVNQEGVITGKSKGTCIIYVYTQNGFSKKVYVTVK